MATARGAPDRRMPLCFGSEDSAMYTWHMGDMRPTANPVRNRPAYRAGINGFS